ADPDAINRLIGIVERQKAKSTNGTAPVVVVSALAGVTDKLVAIAQLAEEGEGARAAAEIEALLERHLDVASAVTGASRAKLLQEVRCEFQELTGLVHALAVLREVSPRSRDAVHATGEIVSSRIAAAAFADRGVESVWLDARRVLVTDAEHTAAAPDMDATCERAQAMIAPEAAAGRVTVVGGFIGATASGVTSTLGRGGSDYSAAIFGAKVLHPSTILPAVAKNIPVRILNSRRPENEGTRITKEARPDAGKLTAIACKRDVTVIDITSTRMLMAHGFLRRLFE